MFWKDAMVAAASLFQIWGFSSRRFWARRLGRLFFVETLGRIHCLTLGDNLFFRIGIPAELTKLTFRAAEFASDAAPAILSKLNEGRNGNHNGDTRMHGYG